MSCFLVVVVNFQSIVLLCLLLFQTLTKTFLTSIGNAKIAGMADDLGMDSNMYSVTLVVFFIGYVLCEVPSK